MSTTRSTSKSIQEFFASPFSATKKMQERSPQEVVPAPKISLISTFDLESSVAPATTPQFFPTTSPPTPPPTDPLPPTETTSLLSVPSSTDTPAPAPAPTMTYNASFFLILTVVFLGDTARGIMFPTLYPLIKTLTPEGYSPSIIQGYAVSLFSFGRVISSPHLGALSDTSFTKSLTYSESLLLLGCCLYFIAPLLPTFHPLANVVCLLVSQCVLGLGSGTLGVTRSYISSQVPREERTFWMGRLTAVQYAGFTVTPAAGAFLCTIFEEDGFVNKYNAPALIMALCAGAVLVCVRTVFKDPDMNKVKLAKVKKVDAPPSPSSSPNSWSNELIFAGASRFTLIILFCFLLNVTTKGTISIYETLTVKLGMYFFPNVPLSTTGYLVSGSGFIGVLILLCFGVITKWFDDFTLIVGGMIMTIVSTSLLLGMSGDRWHVFEAAIFLTYALGYPIGHTAVIGMFSKITAGRPQGKLQGYFASAGSLARMTFPIVSGYIINVTLDGVWWWIIGMLSASTLAVIRLRGVTKRMSEE